jgi:hypothetical protein
MASFIDMPLVAEWLRQFDPDDRPAATRLVEAIMLVNLDYFFSGVRTRILEQAGTVRCPIGLYVEREIRKWRGEPNRLFREAMRRGRVTAYGAGPRPVLPAKTINPEVGSEGLLAWLATEICREHPNEFVSHPGPDQIRAKRIKTFLLLTDFIGSGRRASNYLSAAWRVASVRSWHSGGLLRFGVVAYSGTEEGCRVLSRHPTSPRLSLVAPCPTIRSTFDGNEAATIEAICQRYDPPWTRPSRIAWLRRHRGAHRVCPWLPQQRTTPAAPGKAGTLDPSLSEPRHCEFAGQLLYTSHPYRDNRALNEHGTETARGERAAVRSSGSG